MSESTTSRRIDAHQHYWRMGEADQSAWRTEAHGSIARDYGPDDLAPELDHAPGTASYFLSRITIERGREPGMSEWRKRLFIGLSHNAASPAPAFHLPVDRTVVMGSRIEL